MSLLVVGGETSRARADEGAARSFLPPEPGARRPVRGVEVRLNLPIPLYARPLCPRGKQCILGGGGGFGVFVERRFQSGFALGAGYELSFHAAGSVFEVASLHSVGVRVRYVLAEARAAHPTLELVAGAVALGDVFRIKTGGPFVDLGGGYELEMNETLAFTIGLRLRTMVVVPFTSAQDDVRRSVAPYVDFLGTLHVGIAWLQPRARDR